MPISKLTKKQVDGFREQLIERLTAIYKTVRSDVRSSVSRQPFERDTGDEADDAQQDEILDLGAQLAATDATRAQQMEEALRRIAAGEFGQCVDCDGPIELARLKAVPWATRCVGDQELAESELRSASPGAHPTL